MRFPSWVLLPWLTAIWITNATHADELSHRPQGFDIESYFQLHRVQELALSPDGNWVAFATEVASLGDIGPNRRVYLQSADAGSFPKEIHRLAGAHDLAWIPRTRELAFLEERDGTAQVYSYDTATGAVRQRSQSTDTVVRFRFAPDGRSLAFATRARAAAVASLYEQFLSGTTGILIDPNTTSSHDFVNPGWNGLANSPGLTLWSVQDGGIAHPIAISGHLTDQENTFSWSPDSRLLSVTYVGSTTPLQQGSERNSIGVFDARSRSFQTLAQAGSGEVGGNEAISFSGGEWVPPGRRLLIRRVEESDPWVSSSFPSWAIAQTATPLARQDLVWHPLELYPRGSRFFPFDAATVLVENTVEGVHSLFRLMPSGSERSTIVTGLQGSSSQFSFSADANTVAFVNESLAHPPEIYLARHGRPARQLTSLNSEIDQRIRYHARELSWESADGVLVSGWLLLPDSQAEGPVPLLVHVHGGPAYPFPNAFAPYFPLWPYPLEVLAEQRIAVFIPNYRGTHTYGKRIAAGTTNQALDDIASGVKSLITSGIADPARLGISGHSHGAWLGPLAMTREKIFKASSFAEGTSNSVVMYELMSESANREIHDATIGVSLYDSPQTYLDESPDLHFRGLHTASLFEGGAGGANSASLFMLGFPKAAHRAGMATEFIIYPRSGHNLAIPRLQKESAERNLDWFEFWLRGREDANPSKVAQYLRWREMKDGSQKK